MQLRNASDAQRLGFTKIELFVVVSCIAIVMALVIPTLELDQSGHARRNRCSTQINNLSKASIQYEMVKKKFPGYVNDFGTYIGTTDPSDPEGKGGVYRSGDRKLGSWAVLLLPYLDAQPTYEIWTQDKYPVLVSRDGDLKFTENTAPNLAIMQCPNKQTFESPNGRNSYIANTGMHHLYADGLPIVVSRAADGDSSLPPTPVSFLDSMQIPNGVFNNQYSTATNSADFPVGPAVTLNDFKDGQGNTMLFSESLQAIPWHQLDPDPEVSARLLQPANPGDEVAYPVLSRFTQGMVWHYEDPEGFGGAPRVAVKRGRSINGTIGNQDIEEMKMNRDNAPDLARPSSAHADGVNCGFADGSSRLISDSIDYRVYQSMLTPNGRKSLVPMPSFVLKEDSL